jgi:pimeloyl-ACP methyl ester carboxylesterase
MNALAFSRHGAGPPLVLLHALGASRSCWDPVLPALAERFEVLAVDLSSFGGSAPLPPGVEASPARLAESITDLLDELRIHVPTWSGTPSGAG